MSGRKRAPVVPHFAGFEWADGTACSIEEAQQLVTARVARHVTRGMTSGARPAVLLQEHHLPTVEAVA